MDLPHKTVICVSENNTHLKTKAQFPDLLLTQALWLIKLGMADAKCCLWVPVEWVSHQKTMYWESICYFFDCL